MKDRGDWRAEEPEEQENQSEALPLAPSPRLPVSPSQDFWLREAREALAELLTLEATEGKPAALRRLEVLRQAYLGLRESGEDRPLAELDAGGALDRQIARTRGAWVLWMLRSALGVLDFRDLQRAWEAGEAGTTVGLREWLMRRASRVARRASGTDDEGPMTGDQLSQRSDPFPQTDDAGRATRDARRATSPWAAFFDFWIYGTGLPRYEVKAATARAVEQGFQVTVRVANEGTGTLPVPAVIRTEEGARHMFPVSVPSGETVEASYFVLTRPVQAAVDPDGELLQPEREGAWRPVRLRRWWIF